MLELPESTVLSRQLREAAGGKTVTRAVAGASPHRFTFFTPGAGELPGLLEGRTVDDAQPSGGLVEIALGNLRLTLGDGVNLRWLAPGAARPAKHQLLLELSDGSALAATVQMYGGISAFPAGENENFYYLVTKEKPSPLSGGFDRSYFEGLLSQCKPTLSAKAFLATEQRIPGLGNGVLQDILFQARIHPRRKLETLGSGALDALYHSVKATLADMAQYGGRDTERDLYGQAGGYGTLLSAKTWKGPCPVCGGPIVRQAYLGGNVYFCPHCQRSQS